MESTIKLPTRNLKPVRALVTALIIALALVITAAISIPNLLRSRMAAGGAQHRAMQYEPAQATGALASPKLPDVGRRVVTTGSLDLVAEDPAAVLGQIQRTCISLGGYVESSNLTEYAYGAPSGAITIRVPAARFDEARSEIRKLGKRAQNERVNSSDVTAQYVDLEATLRNYRAEETQYLEIMRRSGTIKETLEVAQRLAEVRGRIERAQAQLNLLSRQVEMASLAVSIRPEPAPAETGEVRWYPAKQARAALHHALQGLADYLHFMLVVVLQLPVILLWVVTVMIMAAGSWRVLRWLWRMLFAHAEIAG